MKRKKCKTCKEYFEPFRPLQVCCGHICAIEKAKSDRIRKEEKESKVERKKAKERLKSRSDWMREAQVAWNAYRRTEDGIERGGKCISCGTQNGKQNCGHYRSVGSTPALRFERLNTWLQCERCNTHLHSNAIEFRIALTKILTPEQLEWLEGPHEPKHYTIDELKEIIRTYRNKLKELKTRL